MPIATTREEIEKKEKGTQQKGERDTERERKKKKAKEPESQFDSSQPKAIELVVLQKICCRLGEIAGLGFARRKCAETSFYQQRHVLKRQQSECECIYLVCAQNANENRLASANVIANRKWNRCGKKGDVRAHRNRNMEQLEMKLINDSHVTFIHNTLDFL